MIGTTASTRSALETHCLTKRFGGLTAVDKVDFQLLSGQVCCLIGPNGAGKTTFFNLVTGVLAPTEGRVLFQGRDITHCTVYEIARLGVARTWQVPSLFNRLSVLENVSIAVQCRHESFNPLERLDRHPHITSEALHVLDRVGLAERRAHVAATLSHAQKKCLELAMALAYRPQLLLLDEPTAGMTVAETSEIARLINEVAAGTTVLVVEHDIDFVREIAHRVTVFHRGRILAEGSLDEIEANPLVREIYLGRGSN